MRKRLLSLLLALCLTLALTPVSAKAEEVPIGGTWNGLKWSYDDEEDSHTLTISGSGPIPDYSWSDEPPYARYYRDVIKKVIVEGGVTGVGEAAFSNWSKLSSVVFQGSVGNIGNSAFNDCDELSSVEFKGNVGNIGNSAFNDCDKLSNITFGGSCVSGDSGGSIGERAFYNCNSLRQIILPEGVTVIMEYAFSSCENLTAIYIPKGVTYISSSAFNGCSLMDIYYGGTKSEWDNTPGYPQSDGLPKIHYEKKFPETEAGDADTLRDLIRAGADDEAGLTRIELTGDIVISDALSVPCNVELDLQGHTISSTAVTPVCEITSRVIDGRVIAGSLTVMDSKTDSKTDNEADNEADSEPTVGEDNRVTYTKIGKISGSGTVIDVQPGGSFTLKSGTVRSSSGDAIAISLAGTGSTGGIASTSAVHINGGYVEAASGAAISASVCPADVSIDGGVVLSGGDAVLLIQEANSDPSDLNVTVSGGTLISKGNEKLSCGIYQEAGSSRTQVSGGKIIVENGIGILVRKGNLVIVDYDQPEISAGGSGKGKYAGSDTDLDLGSPIALDQVNADNRGISCTLPDSLLEEFKPAAYPADGTWELKEEDWGSLTRYSFGEIKCFTIELNFNDGTTPITSIETDSSGRVPELPEPEREGYVFRGWSSESGDISTSTTPGTIINNIVRTGKPLEEDATFYAVWMPEGVYLITFRFLDHYQPEYKLTNANGVLDSWPEADRSSSFPGFPGLPGPRVADGWYTSCDGPAVAYSRDHVFTQDTEVYAHVAQNGTPPYHITFDLNYPTDSTPIVLETDDSSGKLENWPDNPAREGFVFAGWQTTWYGDGQTVSNAATFFKDTVLYAEWIPKGFIPEITFNANGGMVTPETMSAGADRTLATLPTPVREGYRFKGWFTAADGGEKVTTDTVFSANDTIYAHWELLYRVTVIDGTEGGRDYDYAVGDDVEITAIVPAGQRFTGWVVRKGGVKLADPSRETIKFTMPARDVIVQATLKPTYTLTVENSRGNGGSYVAGDYVLDEDVTITAIVPDGMVFDKWTTSGGGTFADAASATTTFTMPASNVTVKANYKPQTFTLTVNGGAGSGEYAAWTKVTINAFAAEAGKVFDKWTTSDGVTFADAASATTTFIMPAKTVTVTANYKDAVTTPKQTYHVTVIDGAGSGDYEVGKDVTITAIVPAGKQFAGWVVVEGKVILADPKSGNTTFTMPARDVTVRATYQDATPPEQKTYTLTVNGGTGGGKYAAGAKVDIKANDAPAGKVFDKWTTSGGGTFENAASGKTTFTMPANDVTVTATYKDAGGSTTPPEQKMYTLTVTGGTGGGKYPAGAKVSIKANDAPAGKVFNQWTSSNGGAFADAASATTTFTMPASDVTVTATYKDAAVTPERTVYVISFDPNGGTVDIPSMVTGTDGKLSSLPIPVYNSRIFNGWYTSPTGGDLISINTVFNGDTTVYAHWGAEYNISDGSAAPPAEYMIVAPPTTGGTVTVSREYATQGASISVTVTPDRGYTLTSLTARDSWWNELKLTDRGGGRYTLTMPNRAVTINATFTAAAAAAGPQPAPVASPSRIWPYPGFADVSASAWYYEAVRFVCETGLMKGLSDGTFSPYDNLSRAQLTQILYNMAGAPAAGSVSGFADVVPSHWYANAVAWAVSRHIVDGYDGGTFGPNDSVTREEIVLMLWRFAGSPASEAELYFSDAAAISTYTQPAVRWAVERGILTGNSDGALIPKGLATRAQVAQMLKNYFNA